MNLDLLIGGTPAHFEDNHLTVHIVSDGPASALDQCNRLVTEFLGHLSLSQARVYQKDLVVFEDETGTVYPLLQYKNLLSVTSYNLDRLTADIAEVQTFMGLTDKRLERAIHYFQLAHLLFERRTAIADVLSPFHTDTIGAAFLFLWKAVTVVLGDPARHQDRYQQRYRQLGYGPEIKVRMDELKKLRDDYDVAHYSLEPGRIDEVQKMFGSTEQFVLGVLTKYRFTLRERSG